MEVLGGVVSHHQIIQDDEKYLKVHETSADARVRVFKELEKRRAALVTKVLQRDGNGDLSLAGHIKTVSAMIAAQ